jgi:hypothetical protein
VGVVNQVAVKHEKLPRVINPCLITTTQLGVSSKCPASGESNYTGWLVGLFLHRLGTQVAECLVQTVAWPVPMTDVASPLLYVIVGGDDNAYVLFDFVMNSVTSNSVRRSTF